MSKSPLVLPEELRKIAHEQLGETPEILEASLKTLREKIAQLPEADRISDTTDENIVRFLRARKFKIDEALERTVQYARFYVKHGQVLEGMKAEEFMVFSEFMTVLKQRDREGRAMLVLQPKKGIGIFTKEFVKQHPRAMLRCNVWMFERLSHDVHVQVGDGKWLCVCMCVCMCVCVCMEGGKDRESATPQKWVVCVCQHRHRPHLSSHLMDFGSCKFDKDHRLASNRFVAFDSSTHSGT